MEKIEVKEKAPFVLVTGNANKARELGNILDMEVENQRVDLPEMQSLNLAEVVGAKARAAYAIIGRPVVVDDVALTMNALSNVAGEGLPGPFIKFFLETLGAQGLADLIHKYSDHRGTAEIILAYFDGQQIHQFVGREEGKIVQPRGGDGFGWDSIFLPDGQDETYAEMVEEVKNRVSHRASAGRKLLEFLRSQKS